MFSFQQVLSLYWHIHPILCDWRGRATQSMDVRHEDTSASVVMVLRRVFSGRIRVTIFVVVGFIEVTQVSKNCSLLCRV